MKPRIFQTLVVLLACLSAHGQVNSGSNGGDGAFNPKSNTVINMADHRDGIYNYTSVNIPAGVTVSFIPNSNNAPVVWLVQSNVVISGIVDVSGQSASGSIGGAGGPGGWAGCSAGSNPNSGQGPGGGSPAPTNPNRAGGGGGSFGSQGGAGISVPGQIYGNSFLLPLLGGSGAGAGTRDVGGGGGGGAILIASSGFIELNGLIDSSGGVGPFVLGIGEAGGGSGGGVRLVTSSFRGSGIIDANGGRAPSFSNSGGLGRVRIDAFQNTSGLFVVGVFTQGYQPIFLSSSGQAAQLTVMSVAGSPVSPSPTGVSVSPDTIISGQQANPIPVVVHCSNIPLNTQITVKVKPANGSIVSAVGYNNTGTLASSTATVSINMPRGGGIIFATAATGN